MENSLDKTNLNFLSNLKVKLLKVKCVTTVPSVLLLCVALCSTFWSQKRDLEPKRVSRFVKIKSQFFKNQTSLPQTESSGKTLQELCTR